MFALLPLVVMGLIVYAVVSAVRRRTAVTPGAGGESSVRRLFIHLMMFVALMVASAGVSGVLGAIISDAAARSDIDLAGPLAMMVVGVPVYVALARWVWRTNAADPSESAEPPWGLYLNAALVVTLVSSAANLMTTASAAFDGHWDGAAAAAAMVWGAVWAGHWYGWRRFPPGVLPQFHLWVGSAGGLWLWAATAGFLLSELITRAIDTSVAAGGADIGVAVTGVATGAVVWIWYWLLHGLRAARSQGWYTYALLAGVLAGLIAAVTGAAAAVFLVLKWMIGDPSAETATEHFRDIAPAVASVIVGLGVWRYHRAVVGRSAARGRTELDRVYRYLVSGVGLVTIAVAVAMLVVATFEYFAPAAVAGATTNTFLLAGTLLLVGVPMWGVAWGRIQRLAAVDPDEISSLTRRMYLFAIFGVGGAVAFVAAINLLLVVFRAIIEGGEALAGELDLPVALLVTTGVTAVYHWMIYRRQREVTVHRVRREVLLVADGIDADRIADLTEARVRVLHRLDIPAGSGPDADTVAEAIKHAEGDHLLVLSGPEGLSVVPFE